MYIDFHLDPALNGVQNMAIDESFFHRFNNSGHGYGKDFCAVRIYEWLSPTLSLGLAQRNQDILNDRFKQEGLEKVVRITGGRVVLHHQEITYSVVGPVDGFWGCGLRPIYEAISDILCCFLQKLGVYPDKQTIYPTKTFQTFRDRSLICYDSMGFKEISLGGIKLIGSAQKRGRYAFLQHGSIPFYRHNYRVENYLKDKFLSSKLKKNDNVFLSDYVDISLQSAKATLLEVFKSEIDKRYKGQWSKKKEAQFRIV